MSTDLLELPDDGGGNGVSLRMNVHGYAWLSVDDGCEFPSYELPPTAEGHTRAQKIIDALKVWIEVTSERAAETR